MTIKVIANGTVSAENKQAFIDLVTKLVQTAREKEASKTLSYEFFLSDNEAEGNLIVQETYADADAIIAHFSNLAPNLAEFVKPVKMKSLSICGPLPQPLLDQFSSICDTAHFSETVDKL